MLRSRLAQHMPGPRAHHARLGEHRGDSMTDDDGVNRDEWREAVSRPLEVTPFTPLSSMVALEVAAASESGKVQLHNTDHYLAIRLGRMQQTILSSLSS